MNMKNFDRLFSTETRYFMMGFVDHEFKTMFNENAENILNKVEHLVELSHLFDCDINGVPYGDVEPYLDSPCCMDVTFDIESLSEVTWEILIEYLEREDETEVRLNFPEEEYDNLDYDTLKQKIKQYALIQIEYITYRYVQPYVSNFVRKKIYDAFIEETKRGNSRSLVTLQHTIGIYNKFSCFAGKGVG